MASIKQAASFNADTERKVVALSEELKDMLREIKIRDQSLQESGVKVETLERRLEATRKQAEQIVELENDVAKAKKQEKVYEDAIEQLQKDLDVLEAENAKLQKGGVSSGGAGGAGGAAGSGGAGGGGAGGADVVAASLLSGPGGEGIHSSEQVENLRAAIRYLRRENALLKGKDLYRDLHLLPPLSYVPSLSLQKDAEDLPDLIPSSPTSSSSSSALDSEDDDLPITPPSKFTLARESKILWDQVGKFATAPKIVDISHIDTKGWTRRRGGPDEQVWKWRTQEKELGRKLDRLKERTRALSRR